MDTEMNILHDELVKIRTYLVKIGPARRCGEILTKKLQGADHFYKLYIILKEQFSVDKRIKKIDYEYFINVSKNVEKLYKEIKSLCTAEQQISTMSNFDLRTALSLLPVMDDQDMTTKQLIDGIEYYDSVINELSKQNLITFVLKSRLSQTAKLRLSSNYGSVEAMVKDMKRELLPRKSATAIQSKMQLMKQGELSINDFGKELSEMFVELTITQAEGNKNAYDVLKPLNEKQAVKRFADGLRNRRLSTIIAARNFENLKDAVQAAVDEELMSTPSTSGEILNMTRGKKYPHYNSRRGVQPGRSFYRRASGNYHRGRGRAQVVSTGSSRGQWTQQIRGHNQFNGRWTRGKYQNNNFNRNHGKPFERINILNEDENQQNQIPENQFFRN